MNLAGIVLLVAFVGLHLLRERDERRAERRADAARKEEHERWVRAFEARVAADTERHRETQAFMERMVSSHTQQSTTQLESLIRLMSTGVTESRAAVIHEREPDATERIARNAAEQTIVAGMNELRESYRALGVEVPDEELRFEAEALLGGTPFVAAHEPAITAATAEQAARS